MLIWLFRNKELLFLDKFDILMMKKEYDLFVIPLSMRKSLIELFHASSGTFHLGKHRTKLLCDRYFTYYGLYHDISTHCATCKQCRDGKKLENRFDPGMGRTSTNVNERLKRFSIDIVNMPPGIRGLKYLLTIIDIATSWIEVYPLRSADSKQVLEKLETDFLPRYSQGLVFLVDGGSHFTSRLMKKKIEANGCMLYITTNYWPNSQVVERMHRTLVSLIPILLIDQKLSKEKWPLTLPEAVRTIRMAPDTATANSPYERVYGKPPVNRIDMAINPMTPLETEELKPYPTQIEDENVNTLVIDQGDTIKVNIKDGTNRTLHKVNNSGREVLVQNIANINVIPPQEILQLKKDFNVNVKRISNKQNYEKRKDLYLPLVKELVDFYRPLDPDSKFSRKLAKYWDGPYIVHKVNPGEKSVEIKKFDVINFSPEDKIKRVHVAYLRPSLEFSFDTRAKLNDKAEWEK